MAFIPRKVVPKKHYAVYTEAGKKMVKTKAAVLKEALGVVMKEEEHVEWIDFIPAKFTLQVHGWFNEDPKEGYTNIKQIVKEVRTALKNNKDPIKVLKGKWHYDLRIRKATAPTWFGLTPFRAPWTGTAEDKVMGTVKGYQSIAPGGKKLEKFLMERAEKELAAQGIAERRDRIEWMRIKAQWFPIDSPGNPQKNQPAAMVAIEYYKPAVLHRRSLDFIDCTFLGDRLKGRYYNRLVEREIPQKDLMEWQKEAISKGQAKQFYILNFYFWKAKDQFNPKEMLQIALGKKTKERIPAPPSKSAKVAEAKEGPSATEVFH